MKKVKNVDGGWMWYCDNVRSVLGRGLTPEECKELLVNKYMKNVQWETAAQEMKNETV